ncbi:MAG: hypothetical protein KDC98_20875 [Planctomycetes bacterium]|nr:hypothetical protein [Planctomycetota bacterium]
MDEVLERFRARSAAEICSGCDFENDIAPWLTDEPDAATFLQRLLDGGAAKDAVRFLCHALEPREAVWLAWDAAGGVDGDGAVATTEALAATSAWLVEGTDELRRAAHDAAERCGLDTAAGCAAMAVFFAEGSLGPPDLEQEVPAPPGTCAKIATGALLLAAVRDPVHADERAAGYVARWFELAATEPPWQVAASGAGEPTGEDSGGYDTDMKF